eukprot:TRINITY_DN22983_c0_g1_i1.p1 TRINITY_DN22983_c0_g1~~TRINITY_DN22983_c0_g1_i1.p1  ORF type:complete len:581 (+),score=156.31 TRINITY_DN22983_c0_g1_i1:90-1832(+)
MTQESKLSLVKGDATKDSDSDSTRGESPGYHSQPSGSELMRNHEELVREMAMLREEFKGRVEAAEYRVKAELEDQIAQIVAQLTHQVHELHLARQEYSLISEELRAQRTELKDVSTSLRREMCDKINNEVEAASAGLREEAKRELALHAQVVAEKQDMGLPLQGPDFSSRIRTEVHGLMVKDEELIQKLNKVVTSMVDRQMPVVTESVLNAVRNIQTPFESDLQNHLGETMQLTTLLSRRVCALERSRCSSHTSSSSKAAAPAPAPAPLPPASASSSAGALAPAFAFGSARSVADGAQGPRPLVPVPAAQPRLTSSGCQSHPQLPQLSELGEGMQAGMMASPRRWSVAGAPSQQPSFGLSAAATPSATSTSRCASPVRVVPPTAQAQGYKALVGRMASSPAATTAALPPQLGAPAPSSAQSSEPVTARSPLDNSGAMSSHSQAASVPLPQADTMEFTLLAPNNFVKMGEQRTDRSRLPAPMLAAAAATLPDQACNGDSFARICATAAGGAGEFDEEYLRQADLDEEASRHAEAVGYYPQRSSSPLAVLGNELAAKEDARDDVSYAPTTAEMLGLGWLFNS